MVSFIIVHYKTYEYTKSSIQSILRNMYNQRSEIILVDNASKDGSIDKLRTDFSVEIKKKCIKIIESPINGGFSYGNNLGYSYAKGEYIVLLNSDAEIQGHVVQNALEFLINDSRIGAVTARVINEFGELDQSCKRGFPEPKNALIYYLKFGKLFPKFAQFNKYKLNHLNEHELHKVDAISGAFMVIPTHVIDEVDFFDETFFMYGEDLDLCYRIKEAGYEIYYNPMLGDVIHYKGQSGKRLKWKTTYEFYRAMWIFYDKHYRHRYPLIVKYLVRIAAIALLGLKMTLGNIVNLIKCD